MIIGITVSDTIVIGDNFFNSIAMIKYRRYHCDDLCIAIAYISIDIAYFLNISALRTLSLAPARPVTSLM